MKSFLYNLFVFVLKPSDIMGKAEFVWMDRKIVPKEKAMVPIGSATLHYGLGVFEGIRCYETPEGPAVFRLEDHIKRLYNSAEKLDLEIPFEKGEILEETLNTIKINNLSECYIRPIVYLGDETMNLGLEESSVHLAIIVFPWKKYVPDNVSIGTSDYMRIHPKSLHADAKVTGHYVNSIIATRKAKKEDYGEALLLDFERNVAEGAGENIFIVKNGKLITPPLEGRILPGITRDTVIKIAENEGIKVVEKYFKPRDIYKANEAFFTGTAAEISAIGYLDCNKIGKVPGKITSILKDEFNKIIHGKNHEYKGFLSYVN